MSQNQRKIYADALSWYADQGVDIAVQNEPVDRTVVVEKAPVLTSVAASDSSSIPSVMAGAVPGADAPALGKSDAYAQAVQLAKEAGTLEELKAAIEAFDGLAIQKTATNLVFSDGNPKADVMLIGEAPGADEDRQGVPFLGAGGQLLDRILKCIDLARDAEDLTCGAYLSNVLNWRPPGNRTPNPAEIEVSLPFIEKHIALAQPKLIILCGGVPAKALLGRHESLSKLRKTWHDYKPVSAGLGLTGPAIPAIVTYHPDYLLKNPAQKKAVWADMLSVQAKLATL